MKLFSQIIGCLVGGMLYVILVIGSLFIGLRFGTSELLFISIFFGAGTTSVIPASIVGFVLRNIIYNSYIISQKSKNKQQQEERTEGLNPSVLHLHLLYLLSMIP